ncbi:MAG: HIT family protein [Geobacteraceae bacterium]|nr:HIT family protein [Geobacteraceae bacterium]
MENAEENEQNAEIRHPTCPFCFFHESGVIAANDFAVAVPDAFPVSPGHTLIIPKRHFASLFDATEDEKTALMVLLAEIRERLRQERNAEGFNIGINDGAVAGQTVFHLHIHLIPRYRGDCPDPRGGVRKLFPDQAPYWKNR